MMAPHYNYLERRMKMSVFTKIESQFDVKFANENDVCFYCLKEYMHDKFLNHEETDPVRAREELKNRLTGQKIYKNKGAYSITICKEHIKKIADEVLGGEEADD